MSLFARECGELGMPLPEPGAYGVAMCFLPVDKHSRLQCEGVIERIAQEEGLTVIGWRRYAGERHRHRPRGRAPPSPTSSSCFWTAADLDEDALERLALQSSPPHRDELPPRRLKARELLLRAIAFLSHHRLQRLMLAPQIESSTLSWPIRWSPARSVWCISVSLHQYVFRVGSWRTLTAMYRTTRRVNTIRGNVSWMNARQSGAGEPTAR